MKRVSAVNRISVSVVIICVATLMITNVLGFIPDKRMSLVKGRAKLCESLAASLTHDAAHNRFEVIESQLSFLIRRNPDLNSAGLRKDDGTLVVAVGDHELKWAEAAAKQDDGCFEVTILGNEGPWGKLEVRYQSLFTGIGSYLNPDFLKLLAVFIPILLVFAHVHLGRILQHLDPSRVVPSRVRETLDNFAEGILLLDEKNRIVLANQAFAERLEVDPERLIGRNSSELPWMSPDHSSDQTELILPWQETHSTQEPVQGIALSLTTAKEKEHIFTVNTVPVLDDRGKYRGAMAAFADITALEEKQSKLVEAMNALRNSRDEVRTQNDELRFLATRDPLTSCLNRRTFFELFESEWKSARNKDGPLSCLMVDIDFFKAINDNFGHSTGDHVLKCTGDTLTSLASEGDVVCRYGGEEFSILLPGKDAAEAAEFADAIRVGLAEMQFEGLAITASLGVSTNLMGASDIQELLDQADKSLYVAKRSGRNKVVRFDQVPDDIEVDETQISRTQPVVIEDEADHQSIPFTAVTALMSALAYRDSATAAHSTRVADLSVLVGRKYMTPREAYVMEIAAMLHDIGKIGVPDSILLKPGPLEEEEWKIMAMHDRFGVEIVNASFRCAELNSIIRDHHAYYDGSHGDGARGKEIPLASRIVAIADAFDAMVSSRPYRKGMPVEQAFGELQRCAGAQFDPDLVDVFIEAVRSRFEKNEANEAQVAKETALSIGLQLERVVDALEAKDLDMLNALLLRLSAKAEQANLPDVAQAAAVISELARDENELANIAEQTHDLLAMCRSVHTRVIVQIKAREDAVQEDKDLSEQLEVGQPTL